MSSKWDAVWAARALDPAAGSKLAALMAADGLDTGFGSVGEESWVRCVRHVEELLRLRPGDSVFEVGCGAGAFLYDLYGRGYDVAGVDRSAALVGYAAEAMPRGRFAVGDAAALDRDPPADAVVSFGVFMYFPSLDYARSVVEAMVARSSGAVAILDVPDRAREAEAVALRQATVGGAEAYAARYAGLDHLYYDRGWLAQALIDCGLVDVQVAGQEMAGYENARFRFNAWGFLPGAARR
jgi:SAM-dependent methyltransferase